MPELRQNMATKEWVIIASERAARPEQFRIQAERTMDLLPAYEPSCPFCPDNEHQSVEIMRISDDPKLDWQLRVVQNKYPALRPEGDLARCFDGIQRTMNGVGYHEVIVESRIHNTSPALESLDDVQRTLLAFQKRATVLREDPRVNHLVCFKNHGVRAGSSMAHPHAQIIGLPVTPQSIHVRTTEARHYFENTGRCVFCAMLEAELEAGERIIEANDSFVAFLPYAAYSPFHLWILPRRHSGCFREISQKELRELAQILQSVIQRLYVGLNDPDYNYMLRAPSHAEEHTPYLHWYVSVVPRVSQAAGFEFGSGMFINTALPEESARFLREQDTRGLSEDAS